MAKLLVNDTTIADYMKRNKCSREEAIELIEYDNAVEGGEETEYDLSPEQQKVVQDMTRKTEHTIKNRKKRERKPNELKEALVAALADYLENECEMTLNGEVIYCGEVTVPNVSRMIHFSAGDKYFDLTLIEKRTPKT